MKKLYILLAVALPFTGLKAQMITPSILASAGRFSTNGNISLSYTIGEMTMVQTFTGGNNILTQGFQQPNEIISGFTDLNHDVFGSFVVYPNVAADNVWIGFELPEAGNIAIEFYDELGRKLSDIYFAKYEGGKIVRQNNVSNLSSGIYFIAMNFTSAKDGKKHFATRKLEVIK